MNQTEQGEALRRLRLFNTKAEELRSYSFIKKAFHQDAGITIKFEENTISATRIGADNEARAAACLILRLFLQTRDRIELHQIAELYQQLPVRDHDKQLVAHRLQTVDAFLDRETELALNGMPITFRSILETFRYGDQAHTNVEKRRMFETWKEIPAVFSFLENTFEYIVGEIIRYILWQTTLNWDTINTLEIASTHGVHQSLI